jgi:hypothetical protein
MSSLKGLLFSQFANDGLNDLIEEMQSKYQPKKGRRFNHNKITYEVSRPTLKDNEIAFEISSKIPEDEVDDSNKMQVYFDEIKKNLSKAGVKPESVEMENIVWDSKKETEKERDYVKLVYKYPLDDLFDTQEVLKTYEAKPSGENLENLPKAPSAFTTQGKLVLQSVRKNIQLRGREHIEQLIGANDSVRASISN